MIDILFSAFLVSLVLVGIHSYFGIEIIKRGIIFTDLAIGQMAALGAAISILLFDGAYIYPLSLLMAILAALLVSYATNRPNQPEAIIGLLYAFSLSAVYIVLSKSYHGMEEFYKLLASDILFTPLPKIIKTTLLYSGIGIVLYFIHRCESKRFKDILFFALFALTVTSSVKLAGVLIVFALLLSPAMIALSLAQKHHLPLAWIIGIVLNLISICISYTFDLPTGYTLVALHTLIAIAIGLVFAKRMRNVEHKG